ncbi:unnamed protein product [Chondrus crispus]|uniref:Tubby C-terminal domain-containing protein n=1 Tax=Chondrus crispus TaxID=2769 RepID=R7Q331_CHOCR|nr:unnamed protein product [Chondrus crispus]CDF32308.1 unnamed protein product [Chondrus crispus]|eukprot:XP_005711973.1 unnamed protein product [Chondrus crispus]
MSFYNLHVQNPCPSPYTFPFQQPHPFYSPYSPYSPYAHYLAQAQQYRYTPYYPSSYPPYQPPQAPQQPQQPQQPQPYQPPQPAYQPQQPPQQPQGYGAAVAGYTGPQYTHPIAPGVQLDRFGLPVVDNDPPLQYAQTFRLEEKVLSASRDSFSIKDAQGVLRYKVDGSISLHDRKSISDMHGRILLKLREARLHLRDRITIFAPTDVALMILQKTTAIQFGTKRVHGYIGGHIKHAPDLVITGNHNKTYYKIMNSRGQEIADVRRQKFSLKNMLTDQDTYHVTVKAGSPAFVCFLAVVLDEIYDD